VLEHFATSRLRADRGFTKHVVATGEPILLSQTSPAVVLAGRPELAPYVARFGIRSMMITPMRARGRCIGHIAALRTREDAGPYMPAMERFAGLVADLLAIGVESGHPASAHPVGGMKRPGDLSDREREVLVLLALGHTNREIAERLVLSVRTVEWHRARIQWKLGVSGRAALARVARTEGLMD
jgi:DNA-binding CsgD family transcriptional regulator